MLKNSPRRLWALIGAAGTLAIVALGYVFFISAQKSERADYDEQTAGVQQQSIISRHKVNALAADNKKLPTYRAQLAALERALPHQSQSQFFLDDMTRLSNQSNVAATAITFSPSAASSTPATATPDPTSSGSAGTTGSTTQGASWTVLLVNVTVQGTPANLDRFLELLQTKEPRAVVLTSVTEAAANGGTSMSGQPTLTLNMNTFVSAS